MVRAALLALALALGAGTPHLGGLLDLASAAWAADQVDAGGHADPDGATTDAGNHFDPDGAAANAGNVLDPDG
jgi:hypothetical protein